MVLDTQKGLNFDAHTHLILETKVLKVSLFENYRTENNKIIGFAAEIMDGTVDTSITGFTATLERFEYLDFTQGIVDYVLTPFIRKPLKTDVSFRYFWLGNNFFLVFS